MAQFLPPSIYIPPLDRFVCTTPGTRPLSATELRAHGRITSTAEDSTVLEPLIDTAAAYLEDRLRCALALSTWKLYLDEFPPGYRGIALPRFPLNSVTSIAYNDPAGAAQTITLSGNIQTQTNAKPPYIVLESSAAWPATYWPLGSIVVTVSMGYSTIPAVFKRMVAYLATTLAQHRMDFEGPAAARGMLDAFCRTHGMRL